MVALSMTLFIMVSVLIFFLGILIWQPDLLSFSNQDNQGAQMDISSDEDTIRDGIHVQTGFIADEGLTLVIANCTNCHSAKLVTQNRNTKEGWTNVIRWMQETQGLWDLGQNEELIVSYLAKNYAPEARGRRKPLEIEWYQLD